MAAMLESLATAFGKELQDKEGDQSQAQRLLGFSTRETDNCRLTSEGTLAAFGSTETMNSQIDSLKAEASAPDSELCLTLERSQYYELTTWVREEEAAVTRNPPQPPRSLVRTD